MNLRKVVNKISAFTTASLLFTTLFTNVYAMNIGEIQTSVDYKDSQNIHISEQMETPISQEVVEDSQIQLMSTPLENVQTTSLQTGGITHILNKLNEDLNNCSIKYEISANIEKPEKAKSSDLIIVLDASDSFDSKLPIVKNQLKRALDDLDKDLDRTMLIAYGTKIELKAPLTNDVNSVKSALDSVQKMGGTATSAALDKALLEYNKLKGTSSTKREVLFLLITDGFPTFGRFGAGDGTDTNDDFINDVSNAAKSITDKGYKFSCAMWKDVDMLKDIYSNRYDKFNAKFVDALSPVVSKDGFFVDYNNENNNIEDFASQIKGVIASNVQESAYLKEMLNSNFKYVQDTATILNSSGAAINELDVNVPKYSSSDNSLTWTLDNLNGGKYTVKFQVESNVRMNSGKITIIENGSYLETRLGRTTLPKLEDSNFVQPKACYNLKINKVDSSDSDKKLSGAVFDIKSASGKIVKTGVTSDNNGVVTVNDLSQGKYTLVEKVAPSGYELSNTPISFEVKDGALATEVVVSNNVIQNTTSNTTLSTTSNTTLNTTANTTLNTTANSTLSTTSDTTLNTTANSTLSTTSNTTLNTTLNTTANSTLSTTSDTTLNTTANSTLSTTSNTTLNTTANSTLSTTSNTTLDTTANTTDDDSNTTSNINTTDDDSNTSDDSNTTSNINTTDDDSNTTDDLNTTANITLNTTSNTTKDNLNTTSNATFNTTSNITLNTTSYSASTGSIKVIVKDSTKVLPGAKVIINGIEQITNANGEATYTQLEFGTYNIVASKDGYNVGVKSETITKENNHKDVVITLVEGNNGAVIGTIVDKETKDPIPGATVNADGKPGIIDSFGNYVVSDLEPGDHKVEAGAKGYTKETAEVIVPDSGAVTKNFELEKGDNEDDDKNQVKGSFTVTVTDAYKLLPGAKVIINGVEKITDLNGKVTFNDLEFGNYNIIATNSGYNAGVKMEKIDASNPHKDVIITLTPGNNGVINGKVTDKETGDPVKDAKVTVDGGNSVGVDDFGNYAVPDLTPGDHEVEASAPGYKPDKDNVTVPDSGSGPKDFELEKGENGAKDKGSFKVIVKDGTKVLPGSDVIINGVKKVTNEKGEATFSDLEFGSYNIVASHDGYNAGVKKEKIDPSNPDKVVIMTLTEGDNGVIYGKVTDKDTGKIVDGAKVSIDGGNAVEVDDFGNYAIGGLKPGEHTIETNAPGYKTDTTDVIILPSEALEQNIELEKGENNNFCGSIKVIVKDKSGELLKDARVIINGREEFTDANGEAVFNDLEYGTYNILVTKDGYNANSGKVTLSPNNKNQVVTIILQEGTEGAIFGKITDDKGYVIPNSYAIIGGEKVEIDSFGNYVKTGLEPGKYNVIASADGYNSSYETVEVKESEATECNFALEKQDGTNNKYITYGQITDKNGNPIEGACAEADGKSSMSDKTGYYVIGDLDNGKYDIDISKDGYVDVQKEIKINNSDVKQDFQLLKKEGHPTPQLPVTGEKTFLNYLLK